MLEDLHELLTLPLFSLQDVNSLCNDHVIGMQLTRTVPLMQGMPEWVDIVNELAPLDTFISKLEK